MKYYKRLNKRRKIFFWLFLIEGFSEILLGILSRNIAMCTLGIVIMIECMVLCTDQINDDIIQNYEKMVENLHNAFDLQLKAIRDIIKNKDEDGLNKLADTIDAIYKEEENDSNEG